jgi:hypothetical protein
MSLSTLTTEVKADAGKVASWFESVFSSLKMPRYASSRFIASAVAAAVLVVLLIVHLDAISKVVFDVFLVFMICRTTTDVFHMLRSMVVGAAAVKALGTEGKLDPAALQGLLQSVARPPSPGAQQPGPIPAPGAIAVASAAR